MNQRYFGLAMMTKGLFAGAVLAAAVQGGQSNVASTQYEQHASMSIQRAQPMAMQPAAMPAAQANGTLTPGQLNAAPRQSWVF